jgi:hypothetical protein
MLAVLVACLIPLAFVMMKPPRAAAAAADAPPAH